MGMQHEGFIDPNTLGEWVGTTFIFHEPITVRDENGQPHDMRVVDTSAMVLPPDITKEDVLHALVNPLPSDFG